MRTSSWGSQPPSRGSNGSAASSLQQALRLDPREKIVQSVMRTFEAGRRIDSDAVDREFEAPQ